MRSITTRLILAFVLVGVTVVALASGIIYWRSASQFQQLTLDQAQNRFVADMALYYQSVGSWDGILEYSALRSAANNRFSGPPGTEQDDMPMMRGRLLGLQFALADEKGEVIVPAGDYQLDDEVAANVLAKGVPVTVNKVRVGTVLRVGMPPMMGQLEQRYLANSNLGLLAAALGGIALAVVLGTILARALTHPIRDLTAAIRATAAGDFKQQVQVRSNDELGTLAAAFNQMSSEIDKLLNARRQMTADIAHDLRNPLTIIGGYVESMRDGVLQPTAERLDAIQTEVKHLERLIDDLRTLSQADAGELRLNCEPMAPVALIDRMMQSYVPLAAKQGVRLLAEVAPNLHEISADAIRLAQVLGNLISNALRYTPAGGSITLAALPGPGKLILSVSDTGKGIPPEALPRIFDRFYRADSSRTSSEESGLGLAIARSIVEAHGGTISAESVPGKGTVLTITLPA